MPVATHLQVAGDAAIGIRFCDQLSDEAERQLAALSSDLVRREQLRDVVRDRGLRQTLLCHAGLPIAPETESAALQGLYLEGALRRNEAIDLTSAEVDSFTTLAGLRLSTALPLVKAALLHLGATWPDYVPFDELVAAACQPGRSSRRVPRRSRPPECNGCKDNLVHCGLAQRHSISFRATAVPVSPEQQAAG